MELELLPTPPPESGSGLIKESYYALSYHARVTIAKATQQKEEHTVDYARSLQSYR